MKQSIKHALELTKEQGLEEVIDKAFEKGAKRKPKTFNIVVQPTRAFSEISEPYKPVPQVKFRGSGKLIAPSLERVLEYKLEKLFLEQNRAKFLAEVNEVLQSGENIIIIPGPDESKTAWEEEYDVIHNTDHTKAKSSISGGFPIPHPMAGFLPPEGIEELLEKTDGIHPDDVFNIAAYKNLPYGKAIKLMLIALQKHRVAITQQANAQAISIDEDVVRNIYAHVAWLAEDLLESN